MTISFKHAFVSAKPDAADTSLVRASNWNADHVLTMATGKILGRATAGTGAVEELDLSVDASGNVETTGHIIVGQLNVGVAAPKRLLFGEFQTSGTPGPQFVFNGALNYMGLGQADVGSDNNLRLGPIPTAGSGDWVNNWGTYGASQFNLSIDGGLSVGTATVAPTNGAIIAGMLIAADGSVVAGGDPGIAFAINTATGFAANAVNLGFWESGRLALNLATVLTEFRVPSDFKYAWSAATNNNSASDTYLYRYGAGGVGVGHSLSVDYYMGVGGAIPGADNDVIDWPTISVNFSSVQIPGDPYGSNDTVTYYPDSGPHLAHYVTNYNASNYGEGHAIWYAHGTKASPTAVVNGDWIGWYSFGGYDGTVWLGPAGMQAIVDGAVSSGVVPLSLELYTGTGAAAIPRFRISSAGIVSVLSTDVATSTTSGAFRVAGGVGIVGDLHVGGAIAVPNVFATSIIGRYHQAEDSGGGAYFEFVPGGITQLVNRGGASNVAFTIRGAASQTANLQEWNVNGGSALAWITAAGDLHAGNTTVVGTITATSGRSSGGVLRLAGGNDSGSYVYPTITLGYNNGDHYRHWISTRHLTSAAGNGIDFFTCDGTEFGTFNANGVLGLTIENGAAISPRFSAGTNYGTNPWFGSANYISAGPPGDTSGTAFYVASYVGITDNHVAAFVSNFGSDGYGEGLYATYARGTSASPSAVTLNDELGYFGWAGYDGAAYGGPCWIAAIVDGAVSVGSVPVSMNFYTGASGTNRRMQISSAGIVSVLNTDAATSSTTGALRVAGGMGVVGDIYGGYNISATHAMFAGGGPTDGFYLSGHQTLYYDSGYIEFKDFNGNLRIEYGNGDGNYYEGIFHSFNDSPSGGGGTGQFAYIDPSGWDLLVGSYRYNGTQVVGARDTGWTAMTGSPDKATAYATSTITLAQLAGRVAQLQASLTAHGLIGA
jgi:hypothetical protein